MKELVKSWIRSKQPRKQRKYRYNAKLHSRKKLVSVHLSKELREKYKKRNVGIKVGDKIKILRGQNKGKEGKIEKVLLKKTKVVVSGIEVSRKDGTKAIPFFDPSNLMIIELNIDDKKRKKIFDRKVKI